MSRYKTLDQSDLEFLRSVVGVERVLIGEAINEDYGRDELAEVRRMPDVLIEAENAKEISEIMAYAQKHKIPVVARGSGTGLVGSSVAIHGGIMISLQKMNKILELDSQNLTVTVEPGVLLMELAAYVSEQDYLYPPDPGEKSATIGGNIATNAGGMRAVKYGVTKDYVRGLEVVLPTGEIVELGGKVVKNSSGFDLKGLMIGSEGTLGIITKAILKILPLPAKSVSLLIPFVDIDHAIGCVSKIMNTKIIPTAVEFMEREVILDAQKYLGKNFPDHSSDAYLLLTYDGVSRMEIEAAYQPVADICFANGGLDLLIVDTDERKDAVWSARSAFLEAIKGSTTEMDECDVVVPKSHLAEMVHYTYTLKEKYNLRIKSFGHAGDGNLHIYLLKDELSEEVWKQKRDAIFDELYSKAFTLQGKVSGEHGIGFAKVEYFAKEEPPVVLALTRAIKKVFDPNLVLNPDKIVNLAK
ncbi:MAG: FAD-binding protein [Erysipelotrichaceae bacterium]|jgi:glycolate oxidase|nr:FAD-binding protein [Erysipelotrichaceae bacterium]